VVPTPKAESLVELLAALPESDRPAAVLRFLRREAGRRLNVAEAAVAAIAADRPLTALGLDSLAAAELQAAIAEALGVEIPLTDLLAGATLDGLTIQLLAAPAPAGDRPLNGREEREETEEEGPEAPLSWEQERLWWAAQLHPAPAALHVTAALAWHGPLALAALRRAWTAATARHPALRTAVLAGPDGRPFQRVLDRGPDLPVADLAGLPPAAVPAAARAIEEPAQRPFALGAAVPLVRALLVRRGPHEHRLLLIAHHLVFDLLSAGVLARDLAALYRAEILGGPPPAPPADTLAGEARRQHRLDAAAAAPHLDWWHHRLAGARPSQRPPDLIPPEPPRRRAVTRSFALPAEVAAGVAALARRCEATPFAVLLAAFDALLARAGAGADLLVACPVDGRFRPGLRDAVGFFAYPLLLRADLAGDPPFREAVARVWRATLDAFAHREVPFARLAEPLRRRDARRTHRLPALFSLVEQPGPLAPLAGLTVALEPLARTHTDAPLALTLVQTPAGLGGVLEADADLYTAATVDLFAVAYPALLAAACADPAAPLSALPLPALLAHRTRSVPVPTEEPAGPAVLAVAATFTAEPLAGPLEVWLADLAPRAPAVALAPYGQLFQALLDPAGPLRRNRGGWNAVLVRAEDLWRDRAAPPDDQTLDRHAEELAAALRAAADGGTPLLIALTPPTPAAAAPAQAFARALAGHLDLAGAPGLHLLEEGELTAGLAAAEIHDPAADAAGHVP
jgi:acyl carrier protein